MCEHCRNIQTWRKFDAPKDYLACIAYIQQLVGQGQFELMTEESIVYVSLSIILLHATGRRITPKPQSL